MASITAYSKAGADDTFAKKGDGGSLPDQSGNSGKFLTTDGTDASWATVTSSGGSVSSDDITDATTVGKAVLTATNAAAARTATGAGTSNFSGAAGDLTGLLDATTTALPGVTMTVQYDDDNATWPTLDSTLSASSAVGWHFVGGSEADQPPSVTGPAVWDRAAA